MANHEFSRMLPFKSMAVLERGVAIDTPHSSNAIRHEFSDGIYTMWRFEDDDPWTISSESNYPSIYRKGDQAEKLQIQTTSYGAMDPEDIRNMIENYNAALRAVEWMEAVLSGQI